MEQREFRIKKPYRILAVRLAGCFAVIGVCLWGLGLRLSRLMSTGPGFVVFIGIPLVLLAGFAWWAYWARLRVDDGGISIRSASGWKKWTWEDFEGGRIERGPALHEYHRVPRNGAEASLTLSSFGAEAKAVCEKEIGKHLHPPVIEVPEELTLRFRKSPPRSGIGGHGVTDYTRRYGKSPLKKWDVRMDASGIQLRRRKMEEHGWDSVREVVVETMSTAHRDFLHLAINLPDRVISLGGPKARDSQYQGPEPRVVRAFLQRHVKADRIEVLPRHKMPDTREALEASKKKLAADKQKWAGAIWGAGGYGLLAAAFTWWGIKKAFGYSVFGFALTFAFVAILWFLFYQFEHDLRRQDFEVRERELEEAENRLGPGTAGKEEKTWAGI